MLLFVYVVNTGISKNLHMMITSAYSYKQRFNDKDVTHVVTFRTVYTRLFMRLFYILLSKGICNIISTRNLCIIVDV